LVLIFDGTDWRQIAGEFGTAVVTGNANTFTADQSYNDNVNISFGTGGDTDFDFDGTNTVITQTAGDIHVTGGGLQLIQDNEKLTIGAGDDYEISWDNTNAIVNVLSGEHQLSVAGTNELSISSTVINAPSNTFQEGGVDISPIGTQDHFIYATACIAEAGSAPALVTVDTGFVDVEAFRTTTADFIHCPWLPPRDYDAGTVTATVYWFTDTGSTGETVTYTVAARSFADDFLINTAFPGGTALTQDAVGNVALDMQITAESGAITVANAAKGDFIFFEVETTVGTLGADESLIIGILIEYTTDTATTQ